MPTISVIIPAFNRKNVIGRAIDSILAQTRPADEIIVVDDGSVDGTAEYLAEHYPMVKMIRQRNKGLSTARNVGIAAASGELIALLDSDDAWLPDKLKAQSKVFEMNPTLGLLGTQKYKNCSDIPLEPLKTPRLKFYPFTAFLKRTWLHPSSVMIPKRVLNEVGGFDPTLKAAEDWDMWARIAYRYPVARIQQPLTAVYEMPDSMSRNRLRQYLSDIDVVAKWSPLEPYSLDYERKLSPLLYQRSVFVFAFLRCFRLHKYGGIKMVKEFRKKLHQEINLYPVLRMIFNIFTSISFTRQVE